MKIFQVDEKLWRSNQPRGEDYRELERLGIREILSMRHYHGHNSHARRMGAVLHHIRTKASKITIPQIIEALRIIRDAQGPVLVHCWRGADRTGAVMAMYRIVFQGVAKREAIREMTGGGFGFHGNKFPNIVRTILGADVSHMRRELGLA